ncbi:AraC family transcriptional regulator [Mesobacterium pallidum]|uniref:AraC family transcriptional regulator n=1 Tax=Mesobacterium pallidum TaxID=2872037 RepID=UPI001EE1616A|nr:AraC family transcriptional regulator [Mesobacterium pallidum]
MGWIDAIFVHKALAAAASLGCIDTGTRAAMLAEAGIDPARPVQPGDMVPDSAFLTLLERIAGNGADGRSVPIRVGAAMRCDDYGAFGLAFKSAPDLLGAYARTERFGRVVTSIANFRVARAGSRVTMEVIPPPAPRPGLALVNELAVAAACALSREVSRDPFDPVAIHLATARPAQDAAWRAHFRCPVHFGAGRDAMELLLEDARRPNRLSDAGMARFFDAHLEGQLGQVPRDDGLAQRVRDQVGAGLSEGVPTLAETAAELGMSSRTLQRRLSGDGLAYQDLVGTTRRALAEHLLSRTDYALAEVAFLTGFSDQSTFTRAFRRWTGQTPASFRRAVAV